jgi:uncharacterized membrane protein YciS (DUF1049 family)
MTNYLTENIDVNLEEMFQTPLHRTITCIGIFFLLFSGTYLITENWIAILISLITAVVIFFLSSIEFKDGPFMKGLFTVFFTSLTSFFGIYFLQNMNLGNAFAIIVLFSVIVSLIFSMLSLFKVAPSKKTLFLLLFYILFLTFIVATTYGKLVTDFQSSFYYISSEQENIISKLGTTGTTLSMSLLLLGWVKQKIQSSKIEKQLKQAQKWEEFLKLIEPLERKPKV